MTARRGVAVLQLVCAILASTPLLADDAEDNAIYAITKLGGTVTRDEKAKGNPVVEVYLSGPEVMDAAVKNLKELKGIHTLVLRDTEVTDKGLTELKKLTRLQSLDIRLSKDRPRNGITDVGM